MRAAALVCRSYYSLLGSAVSPARFAAAAGQYGYSAIALADVNALYGAVDFFRAAQKADIHPILGAHIITPFHNAVLLVENRTGYHNLCRIITAVNLSADFDLTEQLKTRSKGLICISSQQKLLQKLQKILLSSNLFVASDDSDSAKWAQANKINPVACRICNAIDHDDITTGLMIAEIKRRSASPGPRRPLLFTPLIPEDLLQKKFSTCPDAIANTEMLAQRCRFQLLNSRYHLPEIKTSPDCNSDRLLARRCYAALARKYNPVTAPVLKRLRHELNIITRSKFSDYFLTVARIIEYAKQKHIPVDVRGSAAGSLVAHLLDFTRVCPVKNKLYFERFMNPGRKDCPDIDIDLCWRRRDEVINFCYDYWGADHVAMVCNIIRYRRRNALRDVARCLDLDPDRINHLLQQNPSDPTVATVRRLAEKIINIPRHIGIHCGGIVITPRPVNRLVPLQRATKGIIVTQYDKDAAEATGLVKIDLLGNRALSTINQALTFTAASPKPALPAINNIDPADKKTADMLAAGDSLGVFQCESPGMRQLLRALKIRNRRQVGIALSLIRPGPAAGGAKSEFIQRYVYKKPFQYIHPGLKQILADTCGVMLYQEDVMRVAVTLAGYTIEEANRFRSEVSKKVSSRRLQQQYNDFIYSHADRIGLDRSTAETLWEQILRFAAYSYCKAHATVYAAIAWQTAFLKAHYPQQFYASLLNNHIGMYPLRIYVADAARHGLKILPPHIAKSDIEWTCENGAIRAGLNIIKGLHRNTMLGIIHQRRCKPFHSLDDLRTRVKITRPELENLIRVGACDLLGPSRPAMLARLTVAPPAPNQMLLFDIYPSARRLSDYAPADKLKAEIDLTGIPFTIHPAAFLHAGYTPAADLPKMLGRNVTVAGFLAAARTAVTEDKKIMAFVTLDDASGLAEITFFPDRIDQYRKIRSEPGPLRITGTVTEHLNSITLNARAAEPIDGRR